jgi:hypothetical protein
MARENKEHWREGMNPSKAEIEMTARLILQNRDIKSLRDQLADANEIARFYSRGNLDGDYYDNHYGAGMGDFDITTGKRAYEYLEKWKVEKCLTIKRSPHEPLEC